MTKNKSLTQLARKVKIAVRYGARRAWEKQGEWQRNANGFRVCLKYQGRKMYLDFWQGTGISGEPTAAGVLECLLSDASVEGMDFRNWCGEYGYDTDSREAHRTYRQCLRQTAKLRALLGEDFEEFVECQFN